MIELKNISKVYNNYNNNDVTSLRGVNLRLASIGLTFIVGPSGSGKSTLLNILAGIDVPTGGEMTVNGVSTKQFNAKGLDGYRNKFVGIIHQDLNLLDHLTLGQNVSLALELQGQKADPGEISALFEKLGISNLENRYPNQCSGGQCQRAAIARVLIKKPKVMIADEPTSSVDPETRIEIYQLLKDLSREVLIITSTHSREVVDRFADRVITIENGMITGDIIAHDDKTNIEIFGKGEVIAVEPGSRLSPNDVDKLNNIISVNNKKTLYLCLETSVDKVQASHPTAAKEIIQSTIKEKQKQKDVQKQTKRQKIDEETDTGIFQFERTRLPMKNAWGLSVINFKSNKMRSFFTILLSILAITFYAIVSNISSINVNRVTINSFAASNSSYITYSNNTRLYNKHNENKDIWISGPSADQDYVNSSLIYDFGPEVITNPTFHYDNRANVFTVRKIAIEGKSYPGKYNIFGQEILAGHWPNSSGSNTATEIVISDFVANQLQTARFVYNRNIPSMSFEDAVNNVPAYEQLVDTSSDYSKITINNGAITYTIIGIYKTNFRDYFLFDENVSDLLAVSEDVTHFDAISDIRLKPSLTEQQRQQAEYLLQNDFVTGYVSSAFKDNISNGTSWDGGVHSASQTNGGIVVGGTTKKSVHAADYYITQHSSGAPTGNFYNSIFTDSGSSGLLLKPSGLSSEAEVSDGTIMVSKSFYQLIGGTGKYNDETNTINPDGPRKLKFNIAKKVQSYSVLPDALSENPDGDIIIKTAAESYYILQTVEFNINETLLDDDATYKYIMLLNNSGNNSDFDKMMTGLIVPSTSFIIANTYSTEILSKVFDRMGSGVTASYADSAAITEFTSGFTSSSNLISTAAIIIGMFTIFLMFSYIFQSIRSKRKNIAIIRSLGAKTNDIFKIFMLEALLISIMIIAGSFGLIALFGLIGNSIIQAATHYSLMIFSFDAIFITIVLAAALVVIFISYMIPVIGYARHKNRKGLVVGMHVKSDN